MVLFPARLGARGGSDLHPRRTFDVWLGITRRTHHARVSLLFFSLLHETCLHSPRIHLVVLCVFSLCANSRLVFHVQVSQVHPSIQLVGFRSKDDVHTCGRTRTRWSTPRLASTSTARVARLCCLAREEMQEMHMKVVERDTKEEWKGMERG